MGITIADESPLEPGVYHYPAGTIDVAVPVIPDNHIARWVDGIWQFEEIVVLPEPVVEPVVTTPVEPTIADLQAQLVYLQQQISKLSSIGGQ